MGIKRRRIFIIILVFISLSGCQRSGRSAGQQEETNRQDISQQERESTGLFPEYPVYYAAVSTGIYEKPEQKEELKIDMLNQHEPVRIMEQEDGWGKTQLKGSKYGYVQMEDLATDEAVKAENTENFWKYQRTGLEIQIHKYEEEHLVYWVADVHTEDPGKDIDTALAGGSYVTAQEQKAKTSQLAEEYGAIFAINGDSVGARGDGSEYQNPNVIRNGVLYHEDSRNIGDMCAMKEDGTLVIFSPGELGSAGEMIAGGVTDTWWFDCALVEHGQITPSLLENEQVFSKAPYTAIGQKDKNHFIFIVADGRGSSGSEGVTYTGMARLMQEHGAVTAYQLDGGGSSTIWFDGAVLNQPSDGSQRAVSDIIYVHR